MSVASRIEASPEEVIADKIEYLAFAYVSGVRAPRSKYEMLDIQSDLSRYLDAEGNFFRTTRDHLAKGNFALSQKYVQLHLALSNRDPYPAVSAIKEYAGTLRAFANGSYHPEAQRATWRRQARILDNLAESAVLPIERAF